MVANPRGVGTYCCRRPWDLVRDQHRVAGREKQGAQLEVRGNTTPQHHIWRRTI